MTGNIARIISPYLVEILQEEAFKMKADPFQVVEENKTKT